MNRKTFINQGEILTPLGEGIEHNFLAISKQLTALKKFEELGNFKHVFCAGIIENFENIKGFTKLESMLIRVIENNSLSSRADLTQENTLLIIATTKGNIDLLENKQFTEERTYLTALSQQIGNYFNCKNTPILISNACVSGLSAIILAQRLVASGKMDDVVVCAGDLVTEFVLSGFHSFNALSKDECRPFDKDRTGINLGEAAAAITVSSKIQETSSMASQLFPGFGSNDANHISGPSRTGDGLLKCISKTLTNETVSFINAHGTATIYNDEMEAIAFERSGLNHIPTHSLKGYFGHTLGASSLLEIIISNYSLHKNQLIVSKGYKNHGVTPSVNIITQPTINPLTGFLKTASGFGGTNASIYCKKCEA
jgi:3-oxoacyl-[acyl-carrier-protein] synthase-1